MKQIEDFLWLQKSGKPLTREMLKRSLAIDFRFSLSQLEVTTESSTLANIDYCDPCVHFLSVVLCLILCLFSRFKCAALPLLSLLSLFFELSVYIICHNSIPHHPSCFSLSASPPYFL